MIPVLGQPFAEADLAPDGAAPQMPELDAVAESAARALGLVPQEERVSARYLMLFDPDAKIPRQRLLVAMRPDAAEQGARWLMQEIAQTHGPGRVWWSERPVVPLELARPAIADELLGRLPDPAGPRLLVLGSFYFHHAGTP